MTTALPVLDPAPAKPLAPGSPVRPDYAAGPRDLAAVRLLRVSVTDRCNLRCVYCMPAEGVTWFDREDLLGPADFEAVARAARRVGVSHFKITGGEPTIRPDLIEIVERLKALGPDDLSMTTNGLLLDRLAAPLRRAGVDRLTVSLDTLDPDTFKRLIGDRPYTPDDVLTGLDAAQAAGFDRLKLNCVVIGGVNDHAVADLAKLTLDRPWTVRFIEYMPLGDSQLLQDGVAQAQTHIVSGQTVIGRIEAALGPLRPVDRDREAGVGPATVFELPGAAGRIGLISAMSQPFCATCNRLRLTACGELRACLFDGGQVSVMEELRRDGGPRTEQLIALMRQSLTDKPDTHSGHGNRAMSQLGG